MKLSLDGLPAAALRRLAIALMLILATALVPATRALASSFAVQLPPQLFSEADMCAHVPCAEVLPGADSFSPRLGKPPYVEGYQAEGARKRLVGYVFLSTDIVDIPGYSGKPVITLIGIPLAWVVIVSTGLWVLYRVIRGWLALVDRRAMPVPAA